MSSTKKSGSPVGTLVVLVGFAMLATSLILIYGLAVPGATLHNVLQIGGLGLMVVGLVLSRVLKKKDA